MQLRPSRGWSTCRCPAGRVNTGRGERFATSHAWQDKHASSSSNDGGASVWAGGRAAAGRLIVRREDVLALLAELLAQRARGDQVAALVHAQEQRVAHRVLQRGRAVLRQPCARRLRSLTGGSPQGVRRPARARMLQQPHARPGMALASQLPRLGSCLTVLIPQLQTLT